MEKYNELSREQLRDLIVDLEKNLNAAKAELTEKQYLLEKSLNKYDLNGLKTVLNTQDSLNEYDWDRLNFTSLTAKDIDFFLYIKELPEYEHYNKIKNLTEMTKTQEAIYASLNDKDLFDFFINQPDIMPDLMVVLSDKGINPDVDRKVIIELFEKDLLEFNSVELFNKFIERECFNFITYVIENASESFEAEHYKSFYMSFWTTMPDFFLDLIKDKYPEYKNISLYDLAENFELDQKLKTQQLEKMYSIIKYDENLFIRVLEEHKTTAFDINCLMDAFQEFTPQTDKEFHKFIEVIANKKPEHFSTLKRFNCNSKFNKTFQKSLEYLDIQLSLNKNNTTQEKKIKL